MTRYLDPTNDVAFKKLFAEKTRLIGFLNSILKLKNEEKIVDLDYIPTEQMPIFLDGKRSLFDLKVTNERGNWYIIEMQRSSKTGYLNRVQFYGAYTYISQLDKGMIYGNLLPVIVVSIIGDKALPTELPCINYHHLKETTTNKQYLFSTNYVFVELGKFNELEIKDQADEWMHLLKCAHNEMEPYSAIHDKFVLSAYEVLEKFRWTKEEHDAYTRSKLAQENEEAGYEDKYNKGLDIGREQGIDIGREQGIDIAREQGIDIGREQGIDIGREQGIDIGKQAMVIKMLKEGIDSVLIAKITELSSEEIKKYLHHV